MDLLLSGTVYTKSPQNELHNTMYSRQTCIAVSLVPKWVIEEIGLHPVLTSLLLRGAHYYAESALLLYFGTTLMKGIHYSKHVASLYSGCTGLPQTCVRFSQAFTKPARSCGGLSHACPKFLTQTAGFAQSC